MPRMPPVLRVALHVVVFMLAAAVYTVGLGAGLTHNPQRGTLLVLAVLVLVALNVGWIRLARRQRPAVKCDRSDLVSRFASARTRRRSAQTFLEQKQSALHPHPRWPLQDRVTSARLAARSAKAKSRCISPGPARARSLAGAERERRRAAEKPDFEPAPPETASESYDPGTARRSIAWTPRSRRGATL